jgi:tetratricopeptide (TPR) repeat protein
LSDETVQACPPSTLYRFRKFARRNRPALTVGVLLALSLLVMVAGITAGVGWAVRDRAARDDQATREFTARQVKVSGQLEGILDEVAQLEQAEKWSEALVSARRAQPLLAGDEATADIRERVRKTLAELELVQQLDDTRAEGGSVWGDPPPDQMAVADRKYAQAFREFGIDLDALPLAAAVDRIKSRRSILPAVITAIDDWVTVRNLSQGGSDVRRLVDVVNVVDPDPWRQSLRTALASKDWAVVHRLAESAEFDRQPAATFYVLSAALHGTGQLLLEIDVLRRAQWKYPGDFWISRRLGATLIWNKHLDRVEEGIGYIRAAVALRPESSDAMISLGTSHHFQGRIDEAEACYRKAVELNPKYAKARYGLGFALSRQGKLDEAIASYRKAIELDPKYAAAHDALGIALHGQGKLDEAIVSFRKDVELDPKNAGKHDRLGSFLARQGKVDEAIAFHKKAIELDPKLVAAHTNLGNALSRQGKVDEAIACHRKAIELDPNFALAHNNLGHALMKKGQLDEAFACYREALRLKPDFGLALGNLFHLGNTLLRQGKLDEAIAAYRKVIELNPKFASAHTNLGIALYRQGKQDEAIACYLKAVEVDPKSAGPHNDLAWFLATGPDPKFRDPKRAVELAKKAVELAPKEGNYWNTLGTAHYRAGDWKATVAALDKSGELRKGGDSFDWFFLAMAHWQLGEKEEARKWYDRAVAWMDKNNPSDEELRRFREEAAKLLKVEDSSKPVPKSK